MSEKYAVAFSPGGKRYFERLPPAAQRLLLTALEALSGEPRMPNAKKLRNTPFHRLRVSDYRIIYEIRDNELLVLVVKTAHRKEVYRKL